MFEMQNLRKLMVERYTEAHFEALLQMFDRLHDAAVLDTLPEVSTLDAQTMIGWLDDFIFTAQETIRELELNVQMAQAVQHERSNN
jgi:hypothetical protein